MELINLYKLLPALPLALACLYLVYRVSIDVYESLTGVSVSSARRHQRCTRFENGVYKCLFWLAVPLLLPGIAIAVSPSLLVNAGAFIVGVVVGILLSFIVLFWGISNLEGGR